LIFDAKLFRAWSSVTRSELKSTLSLALLVPICAIFAAL
jgi:hypothetical protein